MFGDGSRYTPPPTFQATSCALALTTLPKNGTLMLPVTRTMPTPAEPYG